LDLEFDDLEFDDLDFEELDFEVDDFDLLEERRPLLLPDLDLDP
jgi:hypothetical protein